MPTTMTFETATLVDAVQKASRVAPTKGLAFDKAAGLMFEVDPAACKAVLKASCIDITYSQNLGAVSGKGDPVNWRIPSGIFTSILSGLPMGEGHIIDLIDRGDGNIRISAGRVKARLSTLNPELFPKIEEVDPVGMEPADDLSVKVGQVSWSVDKAAGTPMAGVHMDGTRLIGCCHYSLAVVPCAVPLPKAVTVPLFVLTPLLKQATEIRIRATDKHLHLMLDPETATTTGLIEGKYPDIDQLLRQNFAGKIHVQKQLFMDSLNRMLALARQDRVPTLDIEINCTGLLPSLTFDMEIEDVGRMQDSIDIEPDGFAGTFKMSFNPTIIQQGMEATRGEVATLDFGHATDPAQNHRTSVRVSDKHGYQCYVMPKADNS